MNIIGSLMVCDDFRQEITGQITLVGIYSGDIGIIGETAVLSHMAFICKVEGDLDDAPDDIIFELNIPGNNPFRSPPLEIPRTPKDDRNGRTRWNVFQSVKLAPLQLRAGHITGRLIYHGGEVAVLGPWLVNQSDDNPTKSTTETRPIERA